MLGWGIFNCINETCMQDWQSSNALLSRLSSILISKYTNMTLNKHVCTIYTRSIENQNTIQCHKLFLNR
jgi:hypothetical protein